MKIMEETISGAIVRSYFKKLENNLSVDVAIVGAGPSGLVAARDLALAGLKVMNILGLLVRLMLPMQQVRQKSFVRMLR